MQRQLCGCLYRSLALRVVLERTARWRFRVGISAASCGDLVGGSDFASSSRVPTDDVVIVRSFTRVERACTSRACDRFCYRGK